MKEHSSTEIAPGSFFYSTDDSPDAGVYNNHCHTNYEILYVFEGEGHYTAEGVDRILSPGCFLIVPPLMFHSIHVTGGSVYRRAGFHFHAERLPAAPAGVLGKLFADAGNGGIFVSPEVGERLFGYAFRRVDFAESLPAEERKEIYLGLLSEIILTLGTVPPEEREKGREPDDLPSHVIRYLNGHLTEDISLDDLASEFYVSKFHLCRAFKKKNGISPHGYQNQKRVALAETLMESGVSASDAAFRVGFSDYSTFFRAYVKVFGHSPASR